MTSRATSSHLPWALPRPDAWRIQGVSSIDLHASNKSQIAAQALDYSLKRWGALTRFLDDGQLPIDNNWAENQIRPIAIGRKNWLFAGSLRAGQRAAAVMSLIQSARFNGHDPYAYLKDMLQRLPTHKNHLIAELLPHRWQPLHV